MFSLTSVEIYYGSAHLKSTVYHVRKCDLGQVTQPLLAQELVNMVVKGGSPESCCPGPNPGSATYWLADLEFVIDLEQVLPLSSYLTELL